MDPIALYVHDPNDANPNHNPFPVHPALLTPTSNSLPTSRRTSPLPLRAASRLPPPTLLRSAHSHLSALPPPTSALSVFPSVPNASRKRDRSAWPTSSYASLESSALHRHSSPRSTGLIPFFNSGPPPAQPSPQEEHMSLCQSYSHSPPDSTPLDYFEKAKAVVSTHTRSIRTGLGLNSDSKPGEPEAELKPDSERITKRRKGLAGSIIGTALDVAIDAAIFTSAVGYAAFQIWRGKPHEEFARLSPSSPLPLTPPPPYEPCLSPLPLPRPSPTIPTSSSRRKRSRVHVPRPRQNKLLFSSVSSSSSSLPNLTLDSLDLNISTRGPAPAPGDEEDLLGDFVPSFSQYVPPPPVPEEPVDVELEADEEVLAWKNQIQGLIRSGQAALASSAQLPAFIEPEPESQAARVSLKAEGVNKPEEIRILERALDQTARGTGRNWWESF